VFTRQLSSRCFLGVVFFLVSSSSAFAASTTIQASAEIIEPLTVSTVDDLAFGKISVPKGSLGGEVTLSPDGARAGFGGVELVQNESGDHEASIRVRGKPGFSFHVQFPSQETILSDGKGNQMSLHNLQSTSGSIGVLSSDEGIAQVGVGGSLQVDAGQAPGLYTGSLTVIIQYN
jgi:hypothetical protein